MAEAIGFVVMVGLFLAVFFGPRLLVRFDAWADRHFHIAHVDDDGRCRICGRPM